MLKDVVLGEISGKNAAIIGYDGIIWKIRSGYLTIIFAGWAVLLKGLAEGALDSEKSILIVICMYLASLSLSIGGAMIDRNYVQRKFKVIYALDKLMEAIKAGEGDPALVPVELLKNAGDPTNARDAEKVGTNGEQKFKTEGYKTAQQAGHIIYWTPPILFAGIGYLITYYV
jgi:hypothetical protein